MTVEYTLLEDDLAQAFRLVDGNPVKPAEWLVGVVGAGLLAMVAIPGMVFLAPTPLVAAAYRTFERKERWKISDELVGRVSSVSTSEEAMTIVSPVARIKSRWSTYVRWDEGASMFLVWPDRRTFTVLPKRAFTPEQLEEFRHLLQEKIGPVGQARK